jgi:hypothetical protein
MELDEFIKNTLVSIKNGISGANQTLAKVEGKEMGKDANGYFAMYPNNHKSKEGYVVFDVAVTVSQETKSSGGGGIRIAVASLSGEVSDVGSQEHVSRIKFHILPSWTIM